MKNVEIDEKQISAFSAQIEEKLQDMSREELIKKFVSLEFNRFLDYYRNAKDINVDERDDEKSKKQRKDKSLKDGFRERNTKYSRLFISLGSKDNIAPSKMMGFINRIVDNRDVSIGRIDIMRNFSFFEVDEPHVNEVLLAMRNAKFDGVAVSVEKAVSNGINGGKGDFSKSFSKHDKEKSFSESRRDRKHDKGKKDKKSRAERSSIRSFGREQKRNKK